MPLSPSDQAKLEQLRADPYKSWEPAELVAVHWPEPDGTIHYCSAPLDELPGYEALGTRGLTIDLRFEGSQFLDIPIDSGVSDDRVELDFWDADGEISRLFQKHGEGTRVEIFYYFPELDLLLSQWWGHLRPPDDADGERFRAAAEFGFLSPNLPMPRRGFYSSCSALFGGKLRSQAEIDHSDCPYNRHLTQVALDVFDPVGDANVDTSSGVIKDAGGTDWNAGARHSVAVNEGDEAIIKVTRAGPYAAAGFATTADPRNSNTDFLVNLQWNPDGSLTIQSNAIPSRPNAAASVSGDDLEVHLRGGRFRFYKEGTEIAPSGWTPPAPTYPLYLAVAIQIEGAGVSAVQVKIGANAPAPSVGNLNPETDEPYTNCERNRPACRARLEPPGATEEPSYLGMDTVANSYTVGQTKGPGITVTTRGNESNLKRPLRVIAGERDVQDLDLLAYTPEPNTKHPEEGFVSCLFAECEGPIDAQSKQSVNNVEIGAAHLNARNGEPRQSRTGFSKQVSNYSSTALFFGRAGPGNFNQTSASELRGSAHIRGLKNIRHYSDPNTYVEQYSFSRSWWYLRMLTDKRWGQGYDPARYYIPDFIELDSWFSETVTVHDKDGNAITGQRSQFHAELIDRSAQQQITDLARSGRCSLPYPENGVMRVRPLKRVSDEELAAAIVFTDTGEDRNIVVGQNGNSLLSWSEKSDAELINRLLLTFDAAEHKNAEVPLIFEDVDQQFAAGRAFGDWTRRAVEEHHAAFGVTNVGEAGRLGNLILDLGQLDEGGLKNNLRWTLTTWWTFTIGMTKYQVVKLVSPKLDLINEQREAKGLEPFNYFRVMSFNRRPDLKVELVLQAYPVQYYIDLESEETPPPIPPVPPIENPGGGPGRLPRPIEILDLEHTNDRITFRLEGPQV